MKINNPSDRFRKIKLGNSRGIDEYDLRENQLEIIRNNSNPFILYDYERQNGKSTAIQIKAINELLYNNYDVIITNDMFLYSYYELLINNYLINKINFKKNNKEYLVFEYNGHSKLITKSYKHLIGNNKDKIIIIIDEGKNSNLIINELKRNTFDKNRHKIILNNIDIDFKINIC